MVNRALVSILLGLLWATQLWAITLKRGDVMEVGEFRYQIQSALGRGSFKNVYKATRLDCATECEIALAVPIGARPYVNLTALERNDALARSTSPFIRREFPMVKGVC